MATIATIWVKLGLDSKDYEKGLKSAEKGTKQADRNLSKGLAGGIAQYAVLASAATAAAAVIWDFTQSASDLEESMNKVDVVFGDSAAEIQNWSMNTANSMGISRQAALEAVGTYGNLFTSLGLTQGAASDMSRSLVGLAADMASFNNANPEDVLLALRSGLSGEIEPLKKFGIAMNEVILKQKAMELGLGDNIQALTKAEKIQVRYAVILSQTSNAQGDFARTSDGLANTQRQLAANWEDIKAILGEEFLPALTEVAAETLQFTQWVKDNIEEIKKWGNILGWVTAFPVKLGQATGKLVRNIFDLDDSAGGLKTGFDDLVAGASSVPPAFDEVADASKNAEEALKAQSKAFDAILSNMFTIQSESDRYADTIASNEQRLAEIEQEKIRLALEQTSVQAAGNLTLDRRNDFIKEQISLDEEANALAADSVQALEDKEKATSKLIYQLLQQKAAQDGIVNPEEFRFLQDTAVQMGLVDRASADAAIAASDSADTIWKAFEQPQETVKTVGDLLNDIPANSPYHAQIVIETIGGIPSFSGYGGGSYTSTPFSGAATPMSPIAGPFGFATGADNFMIPPGFPNDSFMAGFSSGEVLNVTPAGSGGSEKNVNITIYPTINEPQDWDYVTQEISRRITR